MSPITLTARGWLVAAEKILQRRVRVSVLVIVQNRVSLTERAAFGVLAGESDAYTLAREARECQRFGRGPIKRMFATSHLPAGFQKLFDFRMRMKIFWQFGHRFEPLR